MRDEKRPKIKGEGRRLESFDSNGTKKGDLISLRLSTRDILLNRILDECISLTRLSEIRLGVEERKREREKGVSQRDNKSVLSPATMGLDWTGGGKEGFKPRPTYALFLSQMDRARRSG